MKRIKTLLVSLVLAVTLCGAAIFAVVVQAQFSDSNQREQNTAFALTHSFATPATSWQNNASPALVNVDGDYIVSTPQDLARMGLMINAG
ncbi:MAG: hypothetical protein FWC80_07790, partial [Firmicutes bacterium]|nr:hypothetical protein [Bacillota bacterium]